MKKLLRNLLKGVSLTAALFVFQACYGTPQPPEAQENAATEEVVEETAPEAAEELPA